MKNKYYTNRHYSNTDKIRIAVNQMNKDMKEISEYCDKLEEITDDLLKFIEDMFDEEVINKSFGMTIKEFIEYIKSKLKGEN